MTGSVDYKAQEFCSPRSVLSLLCFHVIECVSVQSWRDQWQQLLQLFLQNIIVSVVPDDPVKLHTLVQSALGLGVVHTWTEHSIRPSSLTSRVCYNVLHLPAVNLQPLWDLVCSDASTRTHTQRSGNSWQNHCRSDLLRQSLMIWWEHRKSCITVKHGVTCVFRALMYPDGPRRVSDGQSAEEARVLPSLHLTPADHVGSIFLLILTAAQQLLIVQIMILTITNTSTITAASQYKHWSSPPGVCSVFPLKTSFPQLSQSCTILDEQRITIFLFEMEIMILNQVKSALSL